MKFFILIYSVENTIRQNVRSICDGKNESQSRRTKAGGNAHQAKSWNSNGSFFTIPLNTLFINI